MEAIMNISENAGTIEPISRTETGTGIVISDQKKQAVKFHRFPDHCDACFAPLKHENLIGKFKGNVFHVKGYVCPDCGYKVGKIYQKNFKNSTVRFNWRRLEIPRNGKYSGHMAGDS